MLIKTHESVFPLAFFVSYPFILFYIFVQKKAVELFFNSLFVYSFFAYLFKSNLTIPSNRLSESPQFGIHILTRTKGII